MICVWSTIQYHRHSKCTTAKTYTHTCLQACQWILAFELLVLLKLILCSGVCSFGSLTKEVVLPRTLRLLPWLSFENGIQVNSMHALLTAAHESGSSYCSAHAFPQETCFYCTYRNTSLGSTTCCAGHIGFMAALWPDHNDHDHELPQTGPCTSHSSPL